MNAAFGLLLAVLVPAVQANAQEPPRRGAVDGIVTDSAMRPVAGALVSLVGFPVEVTTGENGRFRLFGVPPAEYIVSVRRIGRKPVSSVVSVTAGDTARVFYVVSEAQSLDPVLISVKPYGARMVEFDNRRKLGVGYFLTREQIDAGRWTFGADLIRTFTTVVRVSNGPGGGQLAFNRRPNPGKPSCVFRVFINGMLQPDPYDLSNLPRPRDTAGVELYAGPATIPLEYKSVSIDAACGVILVWTRDGY
ncbi:MAG: carboxypeptidase regulatory-like domain-containing protein [Gemmatimonadetes bacterium]|nr:carboxypeptidase regulatory-like domain-containing protein [Gemmatimonadota bacterium]